MGQVLLLDAPAHKPFAFPGFMAKQFIGNEKQPGNNCRKQSPWRQSQTALKVAEYRSQVLVTGNGPGSNATTVLKNTGLNTNENSSSEKLAICANTAYFGWRL